MNQSMNTSTGFYCNPDETLEIKNIAKKENSLLLVGSYLNIEIKFAEVRMRVSNVCNFISIFSVLLTTNLSDN
jgi:hypothetical protein